MLKSLSKYWYLLLLLCLTMVASAFYLPPSALSSLPSSPSSSSLSSQIPSSSNSVYQLSPSIYSSLKSSRMPSSSSLLRRGSLPLLSRQERNARDLSSSGEREPFGIAPSDWSSSPSSSSSLSSSSSSKESSSASSSSLYSSLSSQTALSRVRRRTRSRLSAYRHYSPRYRNANKRSRRLRTNFYKVLRNHARYRSEQAAVERLFKLFDISDDNVIERDEFRAALELMGIIS
ncbi:hypothetical protein EGW08_002235 [Elysia chlorotica]|uniref:EF-hand domain-containing protein n=1 Tax=Elysia chlorotica TaxID=188477 RepID=A0A3S1BRS6_ELYCH|nr:hypothetical protein EGW08_002235 [Elysia chlorotica]